MAYTTREQICRLSEAECVHMLGFWSFAHRKALFSASSLIHTIKLPSNYPMYDRILQLNIIELYLSNNELFTRPDVTKMVVVL